MAKILVVDDNLDLLEFICFLLQVYKFEVRGASSKPEVFTMVDSFEPDVILMDVMLNDADGREVCKEIKQTHNIPIILLSASAEKLKNYKLWNADATIEKPFEIAKFLEIVKKNLKLKV